MGRGLPRQRCLLPQPPGERERGVCPPPQAGRRAVHQKGRECDAVPPAGWLARPSSHSWLPGAASVRGWKCGRRRGVFPFKGPTRQPPRLLRPRTRLRGSLPACAVPPGVDGCPDFRAPVVCGGRLRVSDTCREPYLSLSDVGRTPSPEVGAHPGVPGSAPSHLGSGGGAPCLLSSIFLFCGSGLRGHI